MKQKVTSHPSEALAIMEVLKRNKLLTDVELQVGAENFQAHKLVLAASSPYFKAMFTGGLKECEMSCVQLQGVSSSAVSSLLRFMYTGEVEVSTQTVLQLLPAATMFQINHVTDACCAFLEEQLDPSNAIGVAAFSLQYSCLDLFGRCNSYIDLHFAEVSEHEEFLQLGQEQLQELLQRDELYVRDESDVYNSVLRWVKHDYERRQEVLETVMCCVRCHYISPKFLSQQLSECDILRNHSPCRRYLRQVSDDLTQHKNPGVKARRPNAPFVIYVSGGYIRHSISNLECFAHVRGVWSELERMLVPRSGLGGAFVKGKMYAVGGRNNSADGNQDSAAVEFYDPITDTWKACKSMSVARNRVGVGVVDDVLYAVGGSHGPAHHKSVERFDPDTEEWKRVADMSTSRIGVGVAVVNRFLYAVGGFDGTDRLCSVERYEVETDSWQTVAPMNNQRSGAGVAAMDQYIYAVGGYDGVRQLKSVERYDTEKDIWEPVADMSAPRSALSVSILKGLMYAFGGYNGTEFLSSVEVYDPITNKWTFAPSMSCGRSGLMSAVSVAPPNLRQPARRDPDDGITTCS